MSLISKALSDLASSGFFSADCKQTEERFAKFSLFSVFDLVCRAWLILGCLVVSQTASAQIIDLNSGRQISEQQLIDQLRQNDVVLLGELHDNAQHHTQRAGLIKQIARHKLTVVAEHLPSQANVADQSDLLSDLEAAGFDAMAWRWPLHSSLFDSVRGTRLPLIGGNLPKGFSKQLFSHGASALPGRLAQSYKLAMLDKSAQQRLDQDLIDGHCGQLPDKYLQPMRLVQRATDLSMAQALLDHQPAVLLAGNGHVRKDYGVPQVLKRLAPELKITAVGFIENDQTLEELVKSSANRYDFIWISAAIKRADPCEDFKIK